MPLAPEEVHRRNDDIYKTIAEQFNPNLKTFLLAARAYEKALTGVAFASRHYFDAMNKLGIIASESTCAKDLGESTRQMSETLRQIQLHHDETTSFLREEVILPLENKLEHDQKYIFGAQRTYQMDYKLKMEELERANAHHQKIKRKSYTGRKSYKYDEKEKELCESVSMKQNALEEFQYDSLKQVFIEERRRYCFFVEQQSEFVRRSIAYHQKSMDSLTAHLSKWLDSCADVRSIPENAEALLNQIRSEDNHSVFSIPEPPNMPAMGHQDGYGQSTAEQSYPNQWMSATNIQGDSVSHHANSTGQNVIPRDSRKKVAALYNHGVPGSPTQLSFDKGDIIILMIPQPRDGWHYGENDRTKERGWFPYTYTKLMDQQEKSQELIHGHMPLPPADYNGTQSGALGTLTQQQDSGNPFASVQLRRAENDA